MIFLATTADPIVEDGTTATQVWSKSRSGADYSMVAAYGTWGSGTVTIDHEVVDGSDEWVTIATLTSAGPALFKQLPNGNYRAVLTGSTNPSLTIVLKPF